jgi:hypothetical protein
MDLNGIESESLEWTHLAQDRDQWRGLVNMVMNRQVAYNVRNLLTEWATDKFIKKDSVHWAYLVFYLCLLWSCRYIYCDANEKNNQIPGEERVLYAAYDTAAYLH